MGFRQEDHKFKACLDYRVSFKDSLGNLVRPHLQMKSRRTRGCSSVTEDLPSMRRALGLQFSLLKT